jgi:hypothetical protein
MDSIIQPSKIGDLQKQKKNSMNQWIGLRENLQESPIFNGKIYGFRLRFSLKPIH